MVHVVPVKASVNHLMFLVQNNPPTIVRERILGLIQYWADAFRGKPQLAEVEELYEQLKGEGIEFPPIDLDALAPIATPQRVSVCVCVCVCEGYMSRKKRLFTALASCFRLSLLSSSSHRNSRQLEDSR